MSHHQLDSYWSFWNRVLGRLGEAGDPRLVLVITDLPGGPVAFSTLIQQQANHVDSLQQLRLPPGVSLFYMDNLLEHAGMTYTASIRRGDAFDSILGAGRLQPAAVHNYLVQALQAFRGSVNSMAYLVSPNLAMCITDANPRGCKPYYRLDVGESVGILVASPCYPARADKSRPIWAPQYGGAGSGGTTPFSGSQESSLSLRRPDARERERCSAAQVQNTIMTYIIAFVAIIFGSTALVLGYEAARRG